MSNIIQDITGGNGTKSIGATKTVDNAQIAAIYVREDCPNLQIFRERYGNESSDTDVTASHFDGTTPKAGDYIRGFGYNFKKVVVGASGSVTLIYN